MVWNQHQYSVATFSDRQSAEEALRNLRKAGFQQAWLSADFYDLEPTVTTFDAYLDDDSDTPACGSVIGSLLGAAGGCVAGLALLLAPEVSIPLAVGAWGSTLLTTITGAGIGAVSGSLIEAMSCQSQKDDRPCHYRLMLDGDYDEVLRANSCLKHSHSSI
ncbi:hypothetical protein IQ268_03365 [Oculatella sp. LEGE 06141]|uniref:hypothetical protein n=1 Tax=Oculatella sp. LEGE 06141 TaxID=1828648 RepID=UPI00187E5362|nr:hypothetical protein [Oculatella sp. LEGE 06141]MBE9177616.1 hypothetical protein [Oculatella sp. LEGE 06141]